MSLYNKYRPKTIDDLVGDFDFIKRTLDNPDGNHSFLFSGSFGCGKTTLARACASHLGADSLDVKEYNFSDTRGIDTVREVIGLCKYAPFGSKTVFIIDEVHGLTTDAANAFLKILEDTPDYVYFFLCTSSPKKVLESIRNRCTKAFMYPLESDELFDLVTGIMKKEEWSVPKSVRMEISERAQGSARDAINLLEAVACMEADKALRYLGNAKVGVEADPELGPLLAAIDNGSFFPIMKQLSALPEKKFPGESIRYILIDLYTKKVMGNPSTPNLRILEAMTAEGIAETQGYGALLVRLSRALN